MPGRALSPRGALLPLGAVVIALAGRLAVLAVSPLPYAFDAFQRWAGREHLLVRDWLPLTQALIVPVARLGGDHDAARLVQAVVASLGAAPLALLLRRLGGSAAAALGLPLLLFGPALAWTASLYQEGAFLTVLLCGLWLAARARDGEGPWWAADLLVGLLGLSRYEGWPVIALYLLWRARPAALLAMWGPLAALALRALAGPGFAPSPIDYADWNGLLARIEPAAGLADLADLLQLALGTGALPLLLLPLLRRRELPARPEVRLLALLLLSQVLVTLAWMLGLEQPIARMMVVPGTLAGLLAALALAPAAARRPRLALALGLLVGALFLVDGLRRAQAASRAFLPEARLLDAIEAGEVPLPLRLVPRAGLGTRQRHDGCEILLGLSRLRAGEELRCAAWPGGEEGAAASTWTWARGAYRPLHPVPAEIRAQ